MKFLFDLFPVIVFFSIFKWGEANPEQAQSLVQQFLSGLVNGASAATQAPILLATAVFIIATVAQIAWLLLRGKKVDTMLWVSFVVISVFGGATIYFHNEAFILWKPTVLYWCFSVALLFGQLLFGKNIIRLMMEKQISLPDAVWQKLSLAWAGFFALMGVVNLYVAYNFPLATWVNFKLFGFTGLMFAFVIAQSIFLSRHMKDSQ
jgi:intracellular septation protein